MYAVCRQFKLLSKTSNQSILEKNQGYRLSVNNQIGRKSAHGLTLSQNYEKSQNLEKTVQAK